MYCKCHSLVSVHMVISVLNHIDAYYYKVFHGIRTVVEIMPGHRSISERLFN